MTSLEIDLQGSVLQSSGRGNIRIEFSKNPLGRKRDFGATGVPTGGAQYGGAAPVGQAQAVSAAFPVAEGEGTPGAAPAAGPQAEGPAPGVLDLNTAAGAAAQPSCLHAYRRSWSNRLLCLLLFVDMSIKS